MGRFRILCLDGGGIRGAYTAAFLAQIEEMNQKHFVDHFDLMVGTSTGGIIALGLGLGIPAQEILEFYLKNGSKIFPSKNSYVGWFFRPKHSSDKLLDCLREVFGSKTLSDSKTRLVIPSFNASSGKIRLFKTAHHERLKIDYKLCAVDVAMSTSAAPTYFSAYKFDDGLTCVDGGVWANCPVHVGIFEALTILEKQIDAIELLSVGTTGTKLYIEKDIRVGGLLKWFFSNKGYILNLIMTAQAEGVLSQAKLLLNDRFIRIDEITHKCFELDDATSVDDLVQLGKETGRHEEKVITPKFFDEEKEEFVPFYSTNINKSGEN